MDKPTFKTVYYWPNGLWVEDQATADLACQSGFPRYETAELPEGADIDQAVKQRLEAQT
ncbi:MAG: hypothetical protein WAT29_02170 [Thiolinea sp.]